MYYDVVYGDQCGGVDVEFFGFYYCGYYYVVVGV